MHRAAALACLVLAPAAFAAEDMRQLASLTPAAQATLRDEMLGNLRAVNEIIGLLGAGKLAEAGAVAETELGIAAMGRNRLLPMDARPGPQMPPAMHRLGIDGHQAASRFADAAKAGDQPLALQRLGELTTSCVACHHAWRVR
ncbi:cytochrome C [Rubrivivax gelatinosus]|uniref:Cytochrome C n=1 Tax=Rubrivivax gelatinosus TaxID=28068 RepID=A0ABS1DYR1_RUBGE|nr:cytochrome C [Rubrivivax gelatinosus]MBK1715227.1 cytochrome C [Rubrivivax gelatinosus]